MMIKRSFPDVRTDLNPQVFFLLDMTGSMGVDKPATINAFNEYIGGLKANEGTAGFKFSLAVFNPLNLLLQKSTDSLDYLI